MPFEKHYDQTPPPSTPACIHLRSKAMCVAGDFDPDHPEQAGDHYCWCNQTQHVLGPDNTAVDRQACIPSRGCYRASH